MSSSYIPLDDSDIEVGKPTKEEIFKRIQENQNCFNTDIELLKQTSVVDIFNIKFAGEIDQYTLTQVSSRVPVFRAYLTGQITQMKVSLLTPSTSGTLQISIDKSIDEGNNWTELLSSPVEITTSQPGDISGSVNFIDPSYQHFNQNDLLRIRIIGLQVDQGEFHIAVSGEIA